MQQDRGRFMKYTMTLNSVIVRHTNAQGFGVQSIPTADSGLHRTCTSMCRI